MKKLIRFGVSIEDELLAQFDKYNSRKKYRNRSESIRDLIRDKLAADALKNPNEKVFGILSFVYDHHKREIQQKLNSVQHDTHTKIVFTTHVHIDHDNCLEMIILNDKASGIKQLSETILAFKGVKNGKLTLIANYR